MLFLYNPFGDPVIAKVAENIDTALSALERTVYVVYYNPVFGHRFDATRHMVRHFAGNIPYATGELGPDTEDPVVVWRGGTVHAPGKPKADARIEVLESGSRVILVP